MFGCFGERLRAESEEEEVVVGGVEKMSGNERGVSDEGFPCFGDRGASDDGFDG